MNLYPYQTQYLANLPPKYIFAADTGTGKTIMALAHYDKHAYLKPLLILAPAAKVNTGDWQRELDEYFDGRLKPEYEVYSYERFSRRPTMKQYKATGNTGLWNDWLKRYPGGFAVICDEVHKAKTPSSGIGKRVFEISQKAEVFIGLSAKPLPNGWRDAINYFKMFGLTKNMTTFKQRYMDIQTFKGFPEVVGYFHEAELQRYWNRVAKPLNKQYALDLPPMTFIPVGFDSGDEYIKIRKERMFGTKFLDNPSALLHALRQSTIEPKVPWLNNFLDGTSDNVVIFYNYKSEREAILKMLAKSHKDRKVFRQDGEKHEVPSKAAWPELDRTITLAQYQSGSTGIELTYASTTIYFSPTYSYSDYEQSIGRTNRNGQTKKMTMYLLCTRATVEADIWSCLREKKDFQERQWIFESLEAEGAKRL